MSPDVVVHFPKLIGARRRRREEVVTARPWYSAKGGRSNLAWCALHFLSGLARITTTSTGGPALMRRLRISLSWFTQRLLAFTGQSN